jgi:hypothetical protein
MRIEERLTVLEAALKKERSKNRWWPLACLTIACVFGGAAATQSSDTLTVKSLTVSSDKPGECKVVISGERGVQLSDSAGRTRMRLVVDDKNGSQVYFFDPEGKTRMALFADEVDSTVVFRDPAGKGRMRLSVDKDGPSIGLNDASGKTRAQLGCVSLKSPTGQVATYRESSFALFGSDGKVIFDAVP